MSETTEEYDPAQFLKLSDREHVRLRVGMYLRNDGALGLNDLARNLIDHAVDEVLGGYATQISVTIHCDGSLSVEHDGRGIPVDRHEEESVRQERDVSALEVFMTSLNCKTINRGCQTSSGMYKIGVGGLVNFLSQRCLVTVWRAGFEYRLCFENGAVVGDLQQVGPTTRSGTRITFWPDPTIFTTTDFDFVSLQSRLRELSLLHSDLTTSIHDERHRVFRFEHGLSQLVEELSIGQWGCSKVFRLDTEGFGARIKIAFQFTVERGSKVHLYVNDRLLIDGGTPVSGLIAGITGAIADEAKKQRWTDSKLSDEFAERLAAVIVVQHPEPQFGGSCFQTLINPELANVVELAVAQYLGAQFAADPYLVPTQWDVAARAAARRLEEDQEHEMAE